METICRVCASSDVTHYTMREMMFGLREKFDYFQCDGCGCLQITSFPNDMAKYYPANYYSMAAVNEAPLTGIKGWLKKLNFGASVFDHGIVNNLVFAMAPSSKLGMLHGLNLSKNARILDVGSGNGQKFLYPLSQIGFKNLLGCDPFLNETITYKNGLKILKASVYDVKNEWDVITYHHAFEHVPDPLENLRHVKSILSPKGTCIIRIPTASSYAWEHYRENWYQVDAPRHFFLHSHESMRILADQAGLKLEKITCDSTAAQFTASEKYRRDIASIEKEPRLSLSEKIRKRIRKQKYKSAAKTLNKDKRGDQAAYYLVHK